MAESDDPADPIMAESDDPAVSIVAESDDPAVSIRAESDDPADPQTGLLVTSNLLNGSAPPEWDGNPLPWWSYDAMAIPLAEWTEASYAYAWYFVVWANRLLWASWAIFPIVSFSLASCNGPGMSRTPSWVLALFLPSIAVSLILEVKAHGRLLPTLVMQLGAFKVNGHSIPFRVYFILVLGLSAVGHTSLGTSGILLARLTRSAMCPESQIESIWVQVVNQSAIKCTPSLMMLGLILWVAMALQEVYGLANSIPIQHGKCPHMDGERFRGLMEYDASDTPIDTGCGKIGSPWMFTCSGKIMPRNGLLALADASRMALVMFRQSEELYKTIDLKHQDPMVVIYRLLLVDQLQKQVWRAVVFLVLEGSLQPNLQSTVFAVSIAASGDKEIDRLTLLSLSLSMFSTLKNLLDAGLKIKKMVQDYWPYMEEDDFDRSFEEEFAHEHNDSAVVRSQTVKRSIAVFAVAATLSSTSLVYSAAKLCAAVMFCESGVWNLSGCVNLGAGL